MGGTKHYKRGSRFSWREVEMAFGIYFWRLHKVAKVQRQLKSRALHLARSLFVFFFCLADLVYFFRRLCHV